MIDATHDKSRKSWVASANGHAKRVEIEPTLKSFREMVKI